MTLLKPPPLRHLRLALTKSSNTLLPTRFLSTVTNNPQSGKNRIYNSVKHPSELHTLILLSTTTRQPLLTLWTLRSCSLSQSTHSHLLSLLSENPSLTEPQGVGFAEVELDSSLIGDLATTFAVAKAPTLLAFSRGEPQLETMVTGEKELRDWKFLEEWVKVEARRGGDGGAGGGWFGGLFGKGA